MTLFPAEMPPLPKPRPPMAPLPKSPDVSQPTAGDSRKLGPFVPVLHFRG